MAKAVQRHPDHDPGEIVVGDNDPNSENEQNRSLRVPDILDEVVQLAEE